MAPRKQLGNGSAQANRGLPRGLPEASVAQKAAAAQIATLKAELKLAKAGHNKATSQLAQQAEKNKKTTLELEKKEEGVPSWTTACWGTTADPEDFEGTCSFARCKNIKNWTQARLRGIVYSVEQKYHPDRILDPRKKYFHRFHVPQTDEACERLKSVLRVHGMGAIFETAPGRSKFEHDWPIRVAITSIFSSDRSRMLKNPEEQFSDVAANELFLSNHLQAPRRTYQTDVTKNPNPLAPEDEYDTGDHDNIASTPYEDYRDEDEEMYEEDHEQVDPAGDEEEEEED
ncbi:hypothetical protein BDY24DRAFT_419495 [Mrakia frigida]|uniref:uncharacterized protein n=1 Tax=Mrakia frigida TaxID=29902 RepID=UPI003FCC16B6